MLSRCGPSFGTRAVSKGSNRIHFPAKRTAKPRIIGSRMSPIVAGMQAATVEVLVTKGKFDPSIAVALAEAIDMAINSSQLVTVPVLDARLTGFESRVDARFAAVEARFDAFESRMDAKFQTFRAELVRWVFLVMLGNVALSAGANAILNALQR